MKVSCEHTHSLVVSSVKKFHTRILNTPYECMNAGFVWKKPRVFSVRQVGLVSWSDGAQVAFHLNQYRKRQDVVQAIRTTRFVGGKTNTAEALRLLRTEIFQVTHLRTKSTSVHEMTIFGWCT